MTVLKKMKFGALALGAALMFASCSSDDDVNKSNSGSLKIMAQAEFQPAMSRAGDNVTLDKFLINFKELELELQNDFYNSEDDIKLKGPWEIDLLSADMVSVVDLRIPNGIYEEIEFEFDKSEDKNSELYGKSMKLTGNINGVPFEFWHDFDEDIEIDYEDAGKNLVIDNNTQEVAINFDLTAAFNTVDLSTATDNNGDGKIMISPTDDDGNQVLARKIKDAIKAQIELLDLD